MLHIDKTVENGTAVFKLEGRLDTVTAPEFESELINTLDGAENLVLDFEKLDYISSAGLRVLLTTQKKMQQKGTMKLLHVCDAILDIFEVTGFTSILNIE